MIVRRYTDPSAYRERVHAFLEREEAVNNLSLGIVYRLAETSQREEARPPLLALVEEQGCVMFVMVMTPPHNVIVYGVTSRLAPTLPPPEGEGAKPAQRAPKGWEGAVDAAVSFLLGEGVSPPGVIGPREVATGFASTWCTRTGCTASVRTEQMIYRLDRVNPITYSPGSLAQAGEAHLGLVAEWMIGFSEVTPGGSLEPAEAQARAEEAVGAGRVYLWYDGAPVSMAWKTRPTRHGITVSGVYTPPELRRHGYATSCVAALSQLLLDEGYDYCTLYTDLANPTSNHIYQEIGYCPIQASIDLVFTALG
jgi:GNAT superfamily N-acetyltransferase